MSCIDQCSPHGAVGPFSAASYQSNINEVIAEATDALERLQVDDHMGNKLKFHQRCGSLVKLTNKRRTAERQRPLDEFNNGVVMTSRPLNDDELFEVCSLSFLIQLCFFHAFSQNECNEYCWT